MKYTVTIFLRSLILATISVTITQPITPNHATPPTQKMSKKKNIEIDDDIPFTEDLMREHGILNRVLLIYEEVIRQFDRGNTPLQELMAALRIIETFIEEYHEKIEETYVFPLFEKNKVQVSLVKTLRKQHAAGRVLTAQIKEETNKQSLTRKEKRKIKNKLRQFIRMYRPHEARENTVLFPMVRSLISEAEFDALGKKFDDIEHKLFGQHGFSVILKKVENIEKRLGIYRLDQFTPAPSQN